MKRNLLKNVVCQILKILEFFLKDWQRLNLAEQSAYIIVRWLLVFASLNYLKFYIRGKRKYFEEPYERYIRVPLETALVYLKYIKRIYIDRVLAVLVGKLRSLNGKYVQKPREEFYYDKLGEQDKANPDTPAARAAT